MNMTKKSRSAIMSSLVVLSSLSACAATKGLWFFGQPVGGAAHTDGEVCADGTVIPNLAADSEMEMKLQSSGDACPNSTYSTTKLPRVSKPFTLYANGNLSEKIGTINSSLQLALKGYQKEADRVVAGSLKATNFGKVVMKDDKVGDFTIELLCKMPPHNSWTWTAGTDGGTGNGHLFGNMIGLSPAASLGYSKPTPVFCYDDYNGGRLYYSSDEDTRQFGSDGWIDSSSVRSHNKGKWALFVFTYEAATTKMVAYIRNDAGYSSMYFAYNSKISKALPVDADSFLQVGGPMGVMKYGLPDFQVGAVRVSDKILAEAEWLTLANAAEDYEDDPVVGWWRFENSAAGADFTECPNERTDLGDPEKIFVRDWVALRSAASGWGENSKGRTNGLSGVYFPVPKTHVAKKRSGSDLVANTLCVGAKDVTVYSNPVKLYVPHIPDAYLPGSLTMEAIVCLPRDATVSGIGQARNTIFGRPNFGIWDSIDKKSSLFICSYDASGTGTTKNNNDWRWSFGPAAWHHVALVYDDAAKTVKMFVDYVEWQSYSLPDGNTIPGAVLPAGGNMGGWVDGGMAFHLLGSPGLGSMGAWGYMDEVRITRGVLTTDDFLKMRNVGMSLLIR